MEQLPVPPVEDHDLGRLLTTLEQAANLTEQYILDHRSSISDLTFFSLISILTDARIALVQLSVHATELHERNLAWLTRAIDELAQTRSRLKRGNT